MKNALILHGTDDNSQKNWFPWLEKELKGVDYKVWVPDLPRADHPNIKRYNKYILEQEWDFNNDTIIIGHSSGAVATLGLLQALPDNTKVNTCYLVGSFNDDLNWEVLTELFETPFDWGKIKSKANKFVFIHSNNDPYCPLDHAKFQAEKLGGELIIKKGQKHFSINTAGEKYKQFPFLLNLILKS